MANGGSAEAIQCDVSDFNACGELAKNVIAKYGRLDILVNNAGVTMIRHFSRSFLKQRSGHIINISSVSGVMGNAGQANYSASKAGLIGLTKSVARELAGRGVCVNAVAPGFVETDMTAAMPETAKEKMTEVIPMGRIGNVSDIAEAVAFLADDASSYITGQVLCVDGGMAI